MADMQELIARLEAAEAGSRELDRCVAKLVDKAEWAKCANWASMPCGATEDVIDRDALRWLPAYTTSLDAALALAERALPEMGPISLCIAGSALVSVDALDPCAPSLAGNIYGRTPALALCIAILKAKAQGEGG